MNLTDEVNDFYYHMALYELQLMNGNDNFHGLSYNSMLYLNVIEQLKDCTVSRLAEALGVTKSAVTIKVNELEKQGAVIRIQSGGDRRVFHIKLSPRMEESFRIYDRVFAEVEEDLTKIYTEEQLRTFTEVLHTIAGYEWKRDQKK